MHGQFDRKSRFVELVNVDVMVDGLCAGSNDSSVVGRVNCFEKGVSLANKFSS